jgi:hypothetical protein
MMGKNLSCMARIIAAAIYLTAAGQGTAQSGMPMWTNRYVGPGNLDDHARALAVDGSGNVFVTGHSWGGASRFDYATIKYSAAGVPLWTNRYNGSWDGGDDFATALAVDSSGKVFVTGYSFGSSTNYEYLTIAYTPAGVPMWTNHYDGLGYYWNVAYAIAVDSSGNVFVTGSSYGRDSGSSSDYATIKYSGGGLPLWTNRYNGPGDDNDVAVALAVDSSGSVVVTGSSIGSDGSSGYATIKYSGAGVPLWTNRHQRPGGYATDVAVDNAGNVFVTGDDYATVKYSGSGVPLWTNRYSRGSGNRSVGYALVVDGIGNVIVTGSSNDGASINYATVKYSGAGLPLWTNLYDGGYGNSGGTDITVDQQGNVFVTGSSYVSPTNSDYATIAYSSVGVPLWTNRYNGRGNGNDGAGFIAVDGSGNVLVTGGSEGSDNLPHYATIKYANLGSHYLSIESDGGGGYFLLFQGTPGTAYRLERAPTLNGPWRTSASQIAPASGRVQFWDLFPTPGQGFYRTLQP